MIAVRPLQMVVNLLCVGLISCQEPDNSLSFEEEVSAEVVEYCEESFQSHANMTLPTEVDRAIVFYKPEQAIVTFFTGESGLFGPIDMSAYSYLTCGVDIGNDMHLTRLEKPMNKIYFNVEEPNNVSFYNDASVIEMYFARVNEEYLFRQKQIHDPDRLLGRMKALRPRIGSSQ